MSLYLYTPSSSSSSSSLTTYRPNNNLVAEADGGVNLDPTLPASKSCRGRRRGGHQQQLAGGGGQEHHPGDHRDDGGVDGGGGDVNGGIAPSGHDQLIMVSVIYQLPAKT